MVAIIFMAGTKHACNDDHNMDPICLQSELQKELNMLTIMETMGTKYACNVSKN